MTQRILTVLFVAVGLAFAVAGLVAILTVLVGHYCTAPALPTAADLYISELEHLRTVHPDGSYCSVRYWTDGVHEAR